MANRFFNQFRKTLPKEQVTVFAKVTFGAAGAPTLVAAYSMGIKSVARNSAGKYTFTFGQNGSSTFGATVDTYNKLLGANATLLTSGAPAAPVVHIFSEAVASGTIIMQFATAAGAATDPANGEAAYFIFDLSNSTAI